MTPKNSSTSFIAILASAPLFVACSTSQPPPTPAPVAHQPSPSLQREPPLLALAVPVKSLYVVSENIREMDRRNAECRQLNGYMDERTVKDGTAAQVRRTLFSNNDGYDCFGGAGEREFSALSERAHKPPPIVPQGNRRVRY